MKPFSIPVVALGPGSREEAEPPDYLVMPRDMRTYRPPSLPEPEDAKGLAGARAVLRELERRLAAGGTAASAAPLDLGGLAGADRRLLDQVLGEGEVSARVTLTDGVARIQESVFAGVWRVSRHDAAGGPAVDALEVGDIPTAVRLAAMAGRGEDPEPPPGPGVVNAPALLAEIRERLRRGVSGEAHVINLSLLPFSPEDGAWLDDALGRGGVSILSRGYGNCRITATGLAGVWWVQYFNSQDALILNTIEVVDVPAVARAAAEDLADSRERLAEVLDWID